MPVSCEAKSGRVTISRAAAPRTYDIVATRQRQVFSLCTPDAPARCRSIMVHRFDLACGGETVPWVEVAAALINENGGVASAKQGRLQVSRAGPPEADGAGCAEPAAGEAAPVLPSYSLHERLPGEPCRGQGAETWVFPTGFAPVGELGATLVFSMPAKPEAAQAPNRARAAVTPAREPAADVRPAPPMRPAQTVVAQADHASAPAESALAEAVAGRTDERSAGATADPSREGQGVSPAAGDAAPGRNGLVPPESAALRLPVAPPLSAAADSEPPPSSQEPVPEGSADTADAGHAAPGHEAALAEAAQPVARQQEDDIHPVLKLVSGARWAPSFPVTLEGWVPAPSAVAEVVIARVKEMRFEREFSTAVMALAVLSGLLAGVGWFASRNLRPRPAAARIAAQVAESFPVAVRPAGAVATLDAQMCGELCTTAHTLLKQIDQRVDELQGVAPLRRVLQREMRHLEQFLAAVTTASPAEPEEWRRMRNRLQRIVKELLRLKDIVEGAYRSLSSAAFQKGEPRDRHEAYEVLGVNPDVSPKTLKKLVDALRACWHPDLAKDDADRAVREERMKRINIAWDIITAKRQEA
jgi:hypothetical protein